MDKDSSDNCFNGMMVRDLDKKCSYWGNLIKDKSTELVVQSMLQSFILTVWLIDFTLRFCNFVPQNSGLALKSLPTRTLPLKGSLMGGFSLTRLITRLYWRVNAPTGISADYPTRLQSDFLKVSNFPRNAFLRALFRSKLTQTMKKKNK